MECLHVVVQNKADLLPESERVLEKQGTWHTHGGTPWQLVSAKTGFNLDGLRFEIGRLTNQSASTASNMIALNQRHRTIIRAARDAVWRAAGIAREPEVFRRHPELFAAEIRHGLDLLGQIRGTISPDEILGRIFSRFCIGK
jgi:tRNA modification GTPase